MKPVTRFVRIIICDNNESLKLEDRILYSGPEVLTEKSDGEIVMALDVPEMLEKHNALRTKTLDKDAFRRHGFDQMLEPVRIHDVTISVINVVAFH